MTRLTRDEARRIALDIAKTWAASGRHQVLRLSFRAGSLNREQILVGLSRIKAQHEQFDA
jgi:hypothetical protein